MAYSNPYYFQRSAGSSGQTVNTAPLQQANIQGPNWNPNLATGPSYAQSPQAPSAPNIGGYASAATGAISMASDLIGMANQRLNINTQTAPIQTDASMKPVYTGGQLVNDISGAKPAGASGGEILSGVGSGAAIGTSILPGWGTAIGAVVGGAASAITGGVRKKRQRREKRRASAQAAALQNQYNTADINFRNSQNAMNEVNQQNNSNARMYNLYRSQY